MLRRCQQQAAALGDWGRPLYIDIMAALTEKIGKLEMLVAEAFEPRGSKRLDIGLAV
jgi:hypothetical protein